MVKLLYITSGDNISTVYSKWWQTGEIKTLRYVIGMLRNHLRVIYLLDAVAISSTGNELWQRKRAQYFVQMNGWLREPVIHEWSISMKISITKEFSKNICLIKKQPKENLERNHNLDLYINILTLKKRWWHVTMSPPLNPPLVSNQEIDSRYKNR